MQASQLREKFEKKVMPVYTMYNVQLILLITSGPGVTIPAKTECSAQNIDFLNLKGRCKKTRAVFIDTRIFVILFSWAKIFGRESTSRKITFIEELKGYPTPWHERCEHHMFDARLLVWPMLAWLMKWYPSWECFYYLIILTATIRWGLFVTWTATRENKNKNWNTV